MSCRSAYSYADVLGRTLHASTALSTRCIFMGWASSHLPAVPSCSQLTCEGSIVFSIHRSQLARHVEKTGTLQQYTCACRLVGCVVPVTCQLSRYPSYIVFGATLLPIICRSASASRPWSLMPMQQLYMFQNIDDSSLTQARMMAGQSCQTLVLLHM